MLWRLCNRLHSRQTRLTVSLLTPRAMNDYIAHYHTERNHQGKNNLLLFPRISKTDYDKPVRCRDRLGGLLRYYHQEAA